MQLVKAICIVCLLCCFVRKQLFVTIIFFQFGGQDPNQDNVDHVALWKSMSLDEQKTLKRMSEVRLLVLSTKSLCLPFRTKKLKRTSWTASSRIFTEMTRFGI